MTKNHGRPSKRGKRRSAARSRSRKTLTWVACAIAVLLILCGLYYYFFIYKKKDVHEDYVPTVYTGELSVHVIALGKYAGDCVLIKAGDAEVLIDGGSREQSADEIERYVDEYCTDGVLEYVVVTHADQDHIAAFAGNGTYKSLFERYECKTIIDFPRTDKTTKVYSRYLAAREKEIKEGAEHYTALQCYNETDGARRSYLLQEGVSMNFLYNYYYEHHSSDENNYSVCMMITQGESHYLFTGDLERDGEEKLVEYNDLPQCQIFKAGHHGSSTSSSEKLLSVIRPKYVFVSCCAGSPEYSKTRSATFPTEPFLKRVLAYTRNIYVTSCAIDVDLQKGEWKSAPMNGTIRAICDGVNITVTGSENSTPLPDTEWFRANRPGL